MNPAEREYAMRLAAIKAFDVFTSKMLGFRRNYPVFIDFTHNFLPTSDRDRSQYRECFEHDDDHIPGSCCGFRNMSVISFGHMQHTISAEAEEESRNAEAHKISNDVDTR